MKINYHNTALGLLENMDERKFRLIDDGGLTSHEEKMKLAHSLIRIWPNILPRFKRKVQYISEPFYEAYQRGVHKLANVIDAEEIDESGVFCFRASSRECNTIFYSIKTTGNDKTFELDATIFIFNKSKDEDKPSLAIVAQRRPGMATAARYYGSTQAEKNGITPISVMADILTMVLFLKYCQLETKIIDGGRKGEHSGTVYKNETKSNIEILDSTWFTTIVRSEGFWVGDGTGGFFRWQPCGEGRKERELIWVQPFEKTGYTKTAKILNQ